MMNGILAGTMAELEDYLVFTMKTEEDFQIKWIPVLDTKLKVNKNINKIQYKFFKKLTNPNTLQPMRISIAEDSKSNFSKQ